MRELFHGEWSNEGLRAVFQSFEARASTFPYHQIKVEYPLLCAAANYWVPSRHAFSFNRIELCPTIEEFATIMGEPDIDDLILPTMGGDLPCCDLCWATLLPWQIGGVSLVNSILGWS